MITKLRKKIIIPIVNQQLSTVGEFLLPLLNYFNNKRKEKSLHLGSDLKKLANCSSSV